MVVKDWTMVNGHGLSEKKVTMTHTMFCSSQVPQPTCYCQLGNLTGLVVAIPYTSPRSFNALQTAHLFSFNLGTDAIGTCGKAVCQSIDFSSGEFFAPARPHLFYGHYVGVLCMRNRT